MAGLEPATSCLEDRHSPSTELHPDKFSPASNLEKDSGSQFQAIYAMRNFNDHSKKLERRDLNSRPSGYQPNALIQLSYAPIIDGIGRT
jgi:hypothetical protein